MSIRKRLMLVGDCGVGKASIREAFTNDSFSGESKQADKSSVEVYTDNTLVELVITNTTGQDEYEGIKPLSYAGNDVILICYSVNNRQSFDNVKLKWISEVRRYCPNEPVLLIGNKKDLRDKALDEVVSEGVVTFKEGQSLSEEINAFDFFECSTNSPDQIRSVLELAARAALVHKSKKHHHSDHNPAKSFKTHQPKPKKNKFNICKLT